MSRASEQLPERAVRVLAVGSGLSCDEILSKAEELELLGWARSREDEGALLIHAEGRADAVESLLELPRSGRGPVEVDEVQPEGHEQFAVRGISAGGFAVLRLSGGGFELRLEVEGATRVWALPKGPTMDPAVKRMAFAAGAAAEPTGTDGDTEVWDEGHYEQGGRVAWPEAIERGHAVFVLHGERLAGGFALQRIRKPNQWLLVKRADDEARRGSDVVAE